MSSRLENDGGHVNVYEYRPAPVGDPKARERVVWVIFGGGGALMFLIALIVALTSDDGLGEGLRKMAVFLVLGLVIAILPRGFRHGIRAQNARRDAFSIAVNHEGVLQVTSIKNVAGGIEKPRFELDEHSVLLREVTGVSFDKETYESGHGNNAYRSVTHFLCIDRTDGGRRRSCCRRVAWASRPVFRPKSRRASTRPRRLTWPGGRVLRWGAGQ